MSIIELIKEWAGVAVLVAGSVWGIAEVYFKWRKSAENTKQDVQTTEQAKLATEERELDLDSRRVKASEEVASESLEHLAEAREENLKLLEDNYEMRKAIVDMQFEIKTMKADIASLKEENSIVGWFFCGKTECQEREPKLGTFKINCSTVRTLKKMMSDGK